MSRSFKALKVVQRQKKGCTKKRSEYFSRVLGKMPPRKMIPGKMSPGKVPPGKLPPGNKLPGKIGPRKIAPHSH